MGDASLIVRFEDVAAMIAAIDRAHTTIVDEIAALRSDVSAELIGWDQTTSSRAAQMAFDARLDRGVQDLAAALARVSAALTTVSEAARHAEVRNVAVLD